MPLPILNVRQEPDANDLVRLFHRTQQHFLAHLGETRQLDFGTAVWNAALPEVDEANGVWDAAADPENSPADIVREADRFFAEQRCACRSWIMNPSVPADRTQGLEAHLAAAGFRARTDAILRLRLAAVPPGAGAIAGVRIIPARASFRHARELALAAVRNLAANAPDAAVNPPSDAWLEQQTEARLAHLDDPHWDSVLALGEGNAALGTIGVLAVGELGRIDHLFSVGSSPAIEQALAACAIEICMRSLFRHVMVGVSAPDAARIAFWERLGFERIGSIATWAR